MNPAGVLSLVLHRAAALWLDDFRAPDLFSMPLFELAEVPFANPEVGEAVLTAVLDFDEDTALTELMVRIALRLGTAARSCCRSPVVHEPARR